MKKGLIIALLILTIGGPARPVLAFTFNPNHIISDEEMTDVFSLDFNSIQDYLDRGFLGSYLTVDYTGRKAYAVDIIYRASQNYRLSPKFLIVLLQKEQSLIEDDEPSENQLAWATGYGVCDACSKSDPEVKRWEGFGKQINSAAAQFREGYLADLETSGVTNVGYGPGVSVTIDDQTVTPINDATAALYSYTPHLAGNENFAEIWNDYFSQIYPNGSLLQAVGEDGVWLIQNGRRRPITSRAALISRYNSETIIAVDPSVLPQYDEGLPISFPNYSLLRSPGGTVYLIVDDERRGIDSRETFRAIGFSEDEIIDVAWDDLSAYTETTPITISTVYPKGRLIQNNQTGGIYFVQDNIKRPLISRTILEVNFSNWEIVSAAPVELETIPTGDPVPLRDGTLVKTADKTAIYVISDGESRPIVSGELFEEMGWQWSNVFVTDQRTLELHPLGSAVTDATTSETTTEEEEV